MKKPLLLFAALTLAISSVFAQQDYQLTQFMADRLSINPGFAGSKDAICATLIGRQQWSGLKGQPSTGLLNVHGLIRPAKSGVGLTVVMDEIGAFSYTQARLAYAYHFRVSGATKLGAGVSFGLMSSSIDNVWQAYDYNSDGTFDQFGSGINDPSIQGLDNGQSATSFDVNFGLYLYNPKYYIGLSATRLTAPELDNINIQVARHYYFMGGYDFELSSVLNLQPNVLAKYDGASAQFDGNVNLMYDNTFWVGVTYRLEDALAPQVGYQYNSPDGKSTLRLGYSYDLTTSELSNYSNGSHEIALSYCYRLEKPLPKRVYKNVRFL